ncbi:Fanconi anemia group A protein-like isoform X1 [Huso huso]|uniref:Fanconi anemia group A protein-like isoform X1 n=1 Tax=Huso huso TaxID=61971 RepID=A0ABR0YXW0_HUSHU
MSDDTSVFSESFSQTTTTQKRTLSALLAARLVKKRHQSENEQDLQEAAIQLLNHHQNLGDLLLEVSPPPPKVLCSKEGNNCGKLEVQTLPVNGDSILVSALQRQASKLGVPVSVLSARTIVERIWELSMVPEGTSRSVLLTTEKRDKMACLILSSKNLLSHNAFSRLLFCKEIWKAEKPPVLEVVWHLHKESIVSLEELLESNSKSAAEIDWLHNDLRLLCSDPRDLTQGSEVCWQIFSDFVTVLVRNAFQESQELSNLKRIPQVCFTVLDAMLSWVLGAVSNDKQEQESLRVKAATFWTHGFDVSVYRGAISVGTLKQFFIHTLTQILTYEPQLKVSDAIGMQSEWSFAKTCPLLTSLYRKLFVLFTAEELMAHLQQVLETHEVNWQNVLSCVSTLLVCQVQAQQKLKDLLTHLLTSAFEVYELESMITAFLLARQASLEGPAVFISYSEWFKISFGNASSYHGNSKKSLVFLLKFLSDLVPFEPPQYLKIHVLHPPYVPTKYRPLLLEYVSLAKTRLADLKVSIEEMGLYEDLSAVEAAAQPQCQAEQDVEKAIVLFVNMRRIPASVMEASIFRRPYYMSRFLPALLSPRVLPDKPDSQMTFIESLKKADKIPASLYSTYIQACQKEKQRQLEGVSVEMKSDKPREPLCLLKAGLNELTHLISDQDKVEGTVDVSAQIALVSEVLKSIINDSSGDLFKEPSIKLNVVAPKLEPLETEVTDLIMKSFCQNLLESSKNNPPNRHGNWASLYVKMLCGHRLLLKIVLTRLLQLTCHQGPSLSGVHILGLSAFVIDLHESERMVPFVDTGVHLVSFTECVTQLLTCSTEESMTFCLRFCIAAVSYGLCKLETGSVEEMQAYVPHGIFKKLQYLIPRLAAEARVESVEDGAESVWSILSDPCLSWKSSALALWRHYNFRKLAKLAEFKLTFKDWVMAELDVQPGRDALSESERQEYQHWACYQQYLQACPDVGGCAGDLVTACTVLINAILDHSQRSKTVNSMQPLGSVLCWYSNTCYTDIICRLQEMVFDLELMQARAVAAGALHEDGHFLFRLIRERFSKIQINQSLSSQLVQQQELHAITRIITSLPPSVLLRTNLEKKKISLNCEEFFHFVNAEQKNGCFRACVLPYDLTVHFFRGLLSSSIACKKPSHAVNAVFTECYLKCPLLMSSAGFWWLKLESVLWSQWSRLIEEPVPAELQKMADCQIWARSALCGKAGSPPSDSPFVLAAFLYFSFLRQSSNKNIGAVLGGIDEDCEQLLVFLLFFSVVDLISSKLHHTETMDLLRAKECCIDIVKHLEDTGNLIILFHVQEKGQSPYQVLYTMMPDLQIELMPLAFYCLFPSLDQNLLSSVMKRQDFLHVALQMYSGMVKLFLDGVDVSTSRDKQPSSKQVDSAELMGAQQFLLQVISQCPQESFAYRKQLEDACADLDPEVKAALTFRLNPIDNDSLYEEPDFL